MADLRGFLGARRFRQHLLPRALLVGVLAGLLAVAFHRALLAGAGARDTLVRLAHDLGTAGILLPVMAGAAGAGAAVWLVVRLAPEAAGSGIPNLEAVLHGLRRMRPERLVPVKFVGGVLGMGAGLAIGREAPSAQMGAAAGEWVSRRTGASGREREALLCAGAAAGLAAAFNAPLSGLIFILEEVRRGITPAVFTAAFVASLAGDVVTRGLSGQAPVFHFSAPLPPPLAALPLFLLLGVAAAPLGVLFNRVLLRSMAFFGARFAARPVLKGVLAGGVVGAVSWWLPDVVGTGEPLLARLLSSTAALGPLLGLFALRFGLTMLSAPTGAPGGLLAPCLIQGAILGLATGELARGFFPSLAPHATSFGVVGMAAFLAASTRAPLTGIVLACEMTGGYNLLLPVSLACLASTRVADALGDVPIFEAMLARDLLRSPGDPALGATHLVEIDVGPRATLAGREVEELGLLPGSLLLSIRRDGQDLFPRGETRLQAGDRLTVVLPPGNRAALRHLRERARGPAP